MARNSAELKPYHDTILHAFGAAAKADIETGVTLVGEDDVEQHRTYRDLYVRAIWIAGALADLGIQKGDRVLIVLPTSYEFLEVFLGAQMLGAIPVPTYPPAGLRLDTGLDRLAHIADASGSVLCVTNGMIRPFLGELALRGKHLDQIVLVEELLRRRKEGGKLRAFADDPAFIQYTSGSTDRPKGVQLTHRNLVSNVHAIGQALRITRTDVTVSWLPLYHDMGLIGTLLFSIYWRIPLVLMSPTLFLLKPSRWLWAIHRHRGTLSPAPNFAYGLCTRRVKQVEREGLDLSSWRLAMNGAEPVDYRTLGSFMKAYAPHGFRPQSMLPVYGLAESSLAVTFPELGREPRCLTVDRAALANGHVQESTAAGASAVVSVGRPVPGHEVMVVDENGDPLPEREVGHVLVRGPSVMRGYFDNPAATAEVIRDGWLWTGDLGFFAAGELYVTGRVKDMIILRGRNIYAEDLERVAERVEGVRAGGALAFGVYDEEKATEMVVMVVETRETDKEKQVALATRVSQLVIEQCDVRIDEIVIAAPHTLPKTSSGKKQRSLARKLYLRQELEPSSTSKLDVAMVYVRSRAGYLLAAARRLFNPRRREPA